MTDIRRDHEVVIAAVATDWWRSKRPVGWSEKQHIENPAVNCNGDREKRLAEVVGEFKRRMPG